MQLPSSTLPRVTCLGHCHTLNLDLNALWQFLDSHATSCWLAREMLLILVIHLLEVLHVCQEHSRLDYLVKPGASSDENCGEVGNALSGVFTNSAWCGSAGGGIWDLTRDEDERWGMDGLRLGCQGVNISRSIGCWRESEGERNVHKDPQLSDGKFDQ